MPSSFEIRMRNFIFHHYKNGLRLTFGRVSSKYTHFDSTFRDIRMRIILIHNPKAGRAEHEADALMEMLAKAGHRVRYQSTKKKGIRKILRQRADLVLVAGG